MQTILVPKVTFPQSMLELIVPEPSVTLRGMEDKRELLQAFAERMNLVCDKMGVPPVGKNRQSELGKMFGVTQKAARKWLVGEGFPDTAICIQIATRANVSFDWLMTGRGSMDGTLAPISPRGDYELKRIDLDTEVAVGPEDLEKIKQNLELALKIIEAATGKSH